MCGIFGIISASPVLADELNVLVTHAQQRGRDSSGLVTFIEDAYQIHRADYPVTRLLKQVPYQVSHLVLGHSRSIPK
jgi:glucosamine--fructose-6-phosphate aminotransferase (isomerizing)